MTKYPISINNFIKSDSSWSDFLKGKSTNTAKRYTRARNEFFRKNPKIVKNQNISNVDKKHGISNNSIFQNEARKNKRQVQFYVKNYSPQHKISKFRVLNKRATFDITPKTRSQLLKILNDITYIYNKYHTGFRMRILCHFNIFDSHGRKINAITVKFNGDITSVGNREFKSLLNQLKSYLLHVIYSNSLSYLLIHKVGIKYYVYETFKGFN